MAAFAWRRRKTRHFDEQWVPFAEINLQKCGGGWQSFACQVDTGAIISIMPRSAAEYLGVSFDNGEPIELGSVGGEHHRYFMHRFEARIGDLGPLPLRMAIAETDKVPYLLGRLDVLERFQIDLDASLEETTFSAPWLDGGSRNNWRHLLATERDILAKLALRPLGQQADEAARRFMNRADQLVASGAGLVKLHRQFELPLVIRALFELSVQFEYLMRDPDSRARLYIEYEAVTKYRTMQAWLKLPGLVGSRLRESPNRVSAEERDAAAYESVRGNYAKKGDGRRERSHWYPGTLRRLAEELGRTAEYDAVYGLYSAWAHGDPWTARLLELGHGGLPSALGYWARILQMIADAKKIVLAADQYEALAELAKGTATA